MSSTRIANRIAGLPHAVVRAALLGAVLAATTSPAEAHTTLPGIGGFWSGVAHLLTSLDQVGFLLGLAIWVGLQDRRDDAMVIAAVAAGAFTGVIAALVAESTLVAPLDIEAIAALLMLAFGTAGTLRLRLGQIASAAGAVGGGCVVGLAGADAAAGGSAALVGLGGATAAASVLSYGLIAAHRCRAEWARIALRALASWIATIGLMMLAFHLRRHFGRA